MPVHGGKEGMQLGIEDIPARASAEDAMAHVFASFAVNGYDIGRIDFGKVTMEFPHNGEKVSATFTKDELKKKQREFGCFF